MSALGCLGCKVQCVTAAGASRASRKHRASAICRANTESSATCSKRQLLGTALLVPSALWGSQLVAAPLAQAEVDSSTVEAAGPAAITALVEGSSASTATASGARQVTIGGTVFVHQAHLPAHTMQLSYCSCPQAVQHMTMASFPGSSITYMSCCLTNAAGISRCQSRRSSSWPHCGRTIRHCACSSSAICRPCRRQTRCRVPPQQV